ncbi:MAG TPA: alkaline phosphatase family protein [Chloroflexota bacterium]|nr:alkaline phosphatase family protein [Chloroflexota bacterium]
MSGALDRAELEWLFKRGALSRRQFVAALAGLGVSAATIDLIAGSDAAVTEAATPHARYLVLVVLDAFRFDYLYQFHMPVLLGLAKRGAFFDRAWVGQMESETPVSHATLGTGSFPAHDGVIGFEWRDPVTGQKSDDGWSPGAIAGDLERDLMASGVTSIAEAIKLADPRAKVASLSSEKVHAASAIGGWAADYVLYYYPGASPTDPLLPRSLSWHEPPRDILTNPHLRFPRQQQTFGDWDSMSTMLALATVSELRPRALLVNFPGVDVYGHTFGGPATPAVTSQVVAAADRNLGHLVKAYRDAGLYDQTLFVVVGDHGMVPNDRGVGSPEIKAAVRQAGGKYMFHTGGTAADIYLQDPTPGPAVAQAVAQLPGVQAAYYRVLADGKWSYVLAKGITLDSKLDAANQFLLSTFAGPTSPDVVAPFRENTVMEKYLNAHGDHGGLNWGAQHVPLIFSGPGVRPGALSHFPARLVDVAPTILRLMGTHHLKMDGIVLTDAVAGATASEVKLQTSLTSTLTAYQDALIQRSQDDIAEDQTAKLLPPPSLPARP